MKLNIPQPLLLTLLLFLLGALCDCRSSAPAGVKPGDDVPYVAMIDRLRKEPQLTITGPDSNPTILIRGFKSIEGNNEPLFVVDGTPLGHGYSSVTSVDVNQVKSIRVLPASQAGLYGSRGGYGVVQIFTK